MKTKVGLFGIGLDTYWAQFDGLLERLKGYQMAIAKELENLNTTVVNAGMVDNPYKAKDAVTLFKDEDVDCVFLLISTYALSHNVLPLVKAIKVPLVILNLQPVKAINYSSFNAMNDRGKMTGEWLAHCQSCVVPELVSVFNRANIPYHLITGYIGEEYVLNEVNEILKAINVIKELSATRIGILGHYYNGMLDVYSDLTLLASTFGNHFEILEFGTLKKIRDNVSGQEISEKINEFQDIFIVSPECEPTELTQAAKTSVAFDKLVERNKLNAIAYYYEGDGDSNYEDIVTTLIPGFTLLTGKNIPVAGEYEIKNVLAMKIMDILGCGGSFSEFYGLDFEDNIVLLGHDGPAHFKIADGKVGLVPLPVFHGKPGKGLSIQMKVVNSPVTLLSVCQNSSGQIFLLTAQGESIEGPTLQIGNTNSRYKFPLHIRDFINKWSIAGPSHHCAIGLGHISPILEKIAKMLNIECVRIC